MSLIRTQLVKLAAKLVTFDPPAPFTARNVQDAIVQATQIPQSVTPTPVGPGQSPYTPIPADQLLLIDTTAGPVVVNMPPSALRQIPLEIKDTKGNASNNNITVNFNGAETGDGLNPYLIDGNYGGVTLLPETGGYFVRS